MEEYVNDTESGMFKEESIPSDSDVFGELANPKRCLMCCRVCVHSVRAHAAANLTSVGGGYNS
jgi:hypothetical protein